MRCSARLASLFPLIALFVAADSLAQNQRVSKKDADTFAQKVQAIVDRSEIPSRTPLRTTVTENEINSYLAIYAKQDLPVGVVNPRINIQGSNRVFGQATVDLDAVRKNSGGGWFDIASYLAGKVPVTVQGVVTTSKGIARFQLESATASGITLPKSLLQRVLTYYSRSPEFPNGINLDDPFQLPARIDHIEMPKAGQAVVVQQ